MNDKQKELLNELIQACWEQSEKSGFHQGALPVSLRKGVPEDTLDYLDHPARCVPEKLVLIASELGEAVEAIRNPAWAMNMTYLTDSGKPEGLGSELADIIIRVFDLAKIVGIDLAEEISQKMAYNATRSFRHGGKLL